MRGVRVEISRDTATPKIQELQKINLKPVLALIGEIHTRKVQIRFDTERDPYGRPWEPRKDPYAGLRKSRKKKKEKLKVRRPILYLTGRLRLSIIYRVHGSGDSVAIGTNVVYAATHEFGDPKRKIPQRSFLGVALKDIQEYKSLIIDFFAGRL